MTVLGLIAGQAFPAGLPAPLAVLGRQVANAGPFLGFLALGFAMASLGHTSGADVGHAAVLCAAKLVLMPLLYRALARTLRCEAAPELLAFLGGLPATASVYSLCRTKALSPRIVGPLVPASIPPPLPEPAFASTRGEFESKITNGDRSSPLPTAPRPRPPRACIECIVAVGVATRTSRDSHDFIGIGRSSRVSRAAHAIARRTAARRSSMNE